MGTYTKLIAAIVAVAIAKLAEHGLDLTGKVDQIIEVITTVLIPLVVWFFPNKEQTK